MQENSNQQQQHQSNLNGNVGPNLIINPHYENIYESLEQYNAAAAGNQDVVNAVGAVNAAGPAENGNVSNVVGSAQHPPNQQLPNNRSANANINYRNDLYDRANNFAYDVPRSVRSSLGMRRNNLQLDLNSARIRYNGVAQRNGETVGTVGYGSHRQRSFDDTESYHYYNINNTVGGGYGSTRYENIYEQIRDEPIYRNTNGAASNSRMYGRLDVIGHGIGRIERHLSSSCGNIDHYNLGGHYAVLGHSHFGTVGHIRLNASNGGTSAQARDQAGVKTSNSSFFSCLGGENSQSMSNIYRVTSSNSGQPFTQQNTIRPNCTALNQVQASSKCTGAIPKSKGSKPPQSQASSSKSSATPASSPEHSSTLNKISKSSLQWLLVNKWLPLWIGQGPDCKIIDFNFMFSRNCDSCDPESSCSGSTSNTNSQRRDLVRFNGRAEMHTRRDPSGRPLRSTLSRLREAECPAARRCFDESNYENVHVQFHNGFEFGRSREMYETGRSTLPHRARSESPSFSERVRNQRQNSLCSTKYSDPFKNYKLNTENNSFKPRTVPKKIRRVATQAESSDGFSSMNSSLNSASRDEAGPSSIIIRSNGKNKAMLVKSKSKRHDAIESVLKPSSQDSNDSDLKASGGGSPLTIDAAEDDQGQVDVIMASADNRQQQNNESAMDEAADGSNRSNRDRYDEAEGNNSDVGNEN